MHLKLRFTSRFHRTMILWCFCRENLILEFLWPKGVETYSQSSSFQGANLGQIPVAFIFYVKYINCRIQETGWFMFCAEQKGSGAAAQQQAELHAMHSKASHQGTSAPPFPAECRNRALYCYAPRQKLQLKKGETVTSTLAKIYNVCIYI